MLHSAKDSFESIASRIHSFRDYLSQNNIRIGKNSVLYTILNRIDTALSIYNSGIIPHGISPNEITSDAANAWFLAEIILCVNGTSFEEIVLPHLSLLASGDPRHIQASKSSLQRNKLFEVILACILNNFTDAPGFIDPPDVVARYKDTLWGFACKTLSGNITTAAKRIREGLNQIEKAQIDFGIVAVQVTNLFPHNQMRFFNIDGKADTPGSFKNEAPAAALMNSLFVDLTKKIQNALDGNQKKYPHKYTTKVRGILYIVQSLCVIRKVLHIIGNCHFVRLCSVEGYELEVSKRINDHLQDFGRSANRKLI